MLNKRGTGYVPTCLFIIIFCMILSVLIVFAGAVGVVNLMKRNSKTVLENYLTQNAIEIYDAVKRGTNEADAVDAEKYVSALASFCTFEKNGNEYYHKNDEGETEYYITEPTVGFTEDGRLRIYASYVLYIPIRFDSVQVTTARVPVTVKVDLKERY